MEYLLALQTMRESLGVVGDTCFNFISNIGGCTLAFIIIGIIYWSINKKLGTKVALNVGITIFFSGILKNVFCIYRPWIRDPRIHPSEKAIEGASGYSFPSGHATLAVNIYGTAGLHAKKKVWKIFLFTLVFLISFSRNVLGVHTLEDVIVGLIIGVVFLILIDKLMVWVEKNQNNDLKFLGVFMAIVAVMLIYANFKSYPIDYVNGEILVDPAEKIGDAFGVAGFAVGILTGWVLERRFVNFKDATNLLQRILRIVVGAISVVVIRKEFAKLVGMLDRRIVTFLLVFIMFFVIMFVWPAIFNWLEKLIWKKSS